MFLIEFVIVKFMYTKKLHYIRVLHKTCNDTIMNIISILEFQFHVTG